MTDLAVLEAAREALGFQLTGGQEQALDNVLRDLEGPAPMMCLLQVRLLLLSACPSPFVGSSFTLLDWLVLGVSRSVLGNPFSSLLGNSQACAHGHIRDLSPKPASMLPCGHDSTDAVMA